MFRVSSCDSSCVSDCCCVSCVACLCRETTKQTKITRAIKPMITPDAIPRTLEILMVLPVVGLVPDLGHVHDPDRALLREFVDGANFVGSDVAIT